MFSTLIALCTAITIIVMFLVLSKIQLLGTFNWKHPVQSLVLIQRHICALAHIIKYTVFYRKHCFRNNTQLSEVYNQFMTAVSANSFFSGYSLKLVSAPTGTLIGTHVFELKPIALSCFLDSLIFSVFLCPDTCYQQITVHNLKFTDGHKQSKVIAHKCKEVLHNFNQVITATNSKSSCFCLFLNAVNVNSLIWSHQFRDELYQWVKEELGTSFGIDAVVLDISLFARIHVFFEGSLVQIKVGPFTNSQYALDRQQAFNVNIQLSVSNQVTNIQKWDELPWRTPRYLHIPAQVKSALNQIYSP